jgi:hypothetical protein
MTTHEQQRQRVIALRFHTNQWFWDGGLRAHCCFRFAAPPGDLAAQMIRHAPGRNLNQPTTGIFGDSIAGPLNCGSQQSLLNCVLAGDEVVESANHGGEHLWR